MFTGIIEEIGWIKTIHPGTYQGQIIIQASKVLDGTKPGDSIAVNGVCLTVTNMAQDEFTADVMAETIRRTNLSSLTAKSPVNLERAMAADGRFGGHIVTGHIDGTGRIAQVKQEGIATWVTVEAPDHIMGQIVQKGSIAIDGISLTVARESSHTFSVSIIPHTGGETTLLKKKSGEQVNLETDILGKYISKLLQQKPKDQAANPSGVTMDLLHKYGF